MVFLEDPLINGMPNKPRTGIYKNCLVCDKLFYVKKHRIKSAKYCSRKCLSTGTMIRFKRNCLVCGKEFEHIGVRCKSAKYCSRNCYYKAQRCKGSIKFNCLHCGKEFNGSPSHVGKRKYCSKRCTGKSYHETFKPSFSTVRKAMIRRNMIAHCNRCGYNGDTRILGVHHKDRNRNNNDVSNLEVLCPNCHSLEHVKHINHGFKE